VKVKTNRRFALLSVALNKGALKITVVNCECKLFTCLSNEAEGWVNRKAPVDHIYTSMSSFTSTVGYTLHVNQEKAKQQANPAPHDTCGYRKSSSHLRTNQKNRVINNDDN